MPPSFHGLPFEQTSFIYTVLPNIYKFPLTELPENESYSGHGGDHTSNLSWNLWGRNFSFAKQNNYKVLNSTCVKVTADANWSQELPQGRHQEHPERPKWWFLIEMASLKKIFCRIFATVLMNFLNDCFTAHPGLPFFLVRHILLTGLSLIPACTSPLIRALRFDSPDWQLQWRDKGGTVIYAILLQIIDRCNFTTY